MAFTSGFFNSVNGDRTYDALQMSQIFDGLIKDGIIKNWLDGLKVSFQIPSANSVVIGTGRAWFDHVWVNNDTPLRVNLSPAPTTYSRYDVIALKIDQTGRMAGIEVFEGVPSATPVAPTVTSTATLKYYPLANVLRRKNAYVSGSDVTDRRGVSPTNWAAALLEDTYSVLGRVQALEAALTPSDWVSVPLPSGFTGSALFRKVTSGISEVAFSVSGTFPAGHKVFIDNLPAAFRPSGSTVCRIAAGANDFSQHVYLSPAGSMTFVNDTGANRTNVTGRSIYASL